MSAGVDFGKANMTYIIRGSNIIVKPSMRRRVEFVPGFQQVTVTAIRVLNASFPTTSFLSSIVMHKVISLNKYMID